MSETDWQPVVSALGYDSVLALLRDFYSNQGMSIREISKIVGFSTWSVRRRLLDCQLSLRSRGGLHHLGKSKLSKVPIQELFESKIADLVFKYDVHAATVANERKRRKEEYAEFLRDLSDDKSAGAADGVNTPHGPSSTGVEGQDVSGVVPTEG